jgi:hypothetical protein
MDRTAKLLVLNSFGTKTLSFKAYVTFIFGRSVAQAVSRWLPTARRPGFDPGSGQVGFVVDRVALGQVFSRENQ